MEGVRRGSARGRGIHQARNNRTGSEAWPPHDDGMGLEDREGNRVTDLIVATTILSIQALPSRSRLCVVCSSGAEGLKS